jgi:hypothetical protein
LYFRSVGTWLLLAAAANLNGILRNSLITPWIGEHGGHIVSTVLLCGIIILLTMWLIKWIGPRDRKDAVAIGALWVSMTATFEFLAGHYLFGHPWSRIVADYNIAAGRVWPLVLVATFAAPLLSARSRRLFPG